MPHEQAVLVEYVNLCNNNKKNLKVNIKSADKYFIRMIKGFKG